MDTIVEVPAAFKAASSCCSLLFDLAESARCAASSGEPFVYADLERAFACGVSALQRDLHAVVLAAMACEQPRVLINGVPHRRVLRTAATYHSLAGDLVVERWLYRSLHDPEAFAVDPIALRVGTIASTWLPATATAMAFLVQQAPVREAVQTARALGVLPYSAASFHRITQAVGEVYEAHQDAIEDALIERYEVPAEATGITLSLDRVAGPFEVPRSRRRGRPKKKAPRRPISRIWKMIYCASLTRPPAQLRAVVDCRKLRDELAVTVPRGQGEVAKPNSPPPGGPCLPRLPERPRRRNPVVRPVSALATSASPTSSISKRLGKPAPRRARRPWRKVSPRAPCAAGSNALTTTNHPTPCNASSRPPTGCACSIASSPPPSSSSSSWAARSLRTIV